MTNNLVYVCFGKLEDLRADALPTATFNVSQVIRRTEYHVVVETIVSTVKDRGQIFCWTHTVGSYSSLFGADREIIDKLNADKDAELKAVIDYLSEGERRVRKATVLIPEDQKVHGSFDGLKTGA